MARTGPRERERRRKRGRERRRKRGEAGARAGRDRRLPRFRLENRFRGRKRSGEEGGRPRAVACAPPRRRRLRARPKTKTIVWLGPPEPPRDADGYKSTRIPTSTPPCMHTYTHRSIHTYSQHAIRTHGTIHTYNRVSTQYVHTVAYTTTASSLETVSDVCFTHLSLVVFARTHCRSLPNWCGALRWEEGIERGTRDTPATGTDNGYSNENDSNDERPELAYCREPRAPTPTSAYSVCCTAQRSPPTPAH